MKRYEYIVPNSNKTSNISTINYEKPPIPEGVKYLSGRWNDKFIIESDTDGSQFVWIPIMNLNFQKAFEDKQPELLENAEKYGGFYLSCYTISKGVNGNPQSVEGAMPWTYINFDEAKEIASSMIENVEVQSYLPYRAEYEKMFEWIIQSGDKSHEEMETDSSQWGNYWNTKNSTQTIAETGSCEKWCSNGIYDLAGNIREWTQEQKYTPSPVIVGGSCYSNGHEYPVTKYHASSPKFKSRTIGFRVALYIKK